MSNRRIVIRQNAKFQDVGYYVGWICRYRDEVEYELRPIGSSSTVRVCLLDSGEFRGCPSRDEREAVRQYLLAERAEFVTWCGKQSPAVDPADYPSCQVLA